MPDVKLLTSREFAARRQWFFLSHVQQGITDRVMFPHSSTVSITRDDFAFSTVTALTNNPKPSLMNVTSRRATWLS